MQYNRERARARARARISHAILKFQDDLGTFGLGLVHDF